MTALGRNIDGAPAVVDERRERVMKRVWAWLIGGALMVVLAVAASRYQWQDQSSDPTGPRYDQRQGESMAGKQETTRDTPSEDARARDIIETAKPLALTTEQREQIRARIGGRGEARVESADFTLTIGSGVPRQVQLQPLPVEVADIMGGYHGSEYLIVADQLVIVDAESRRVTALVPGIN
jgi:hypothetical protein